MYGNRSKLYYMFAKKKYLNMYNNHSVMTKRYSRKMHEI